MKTRRVIREFDGGCLIMEVVKGEWRIDLYDEAGEHMRTLHLEYSNDPRAQREYQRWESGR
jgi:hypothetical protein